MTIPTFSAARAALALAVALPLAAAALLARDPAPAEPAPHTVVVRVTGADGAEVFRRGVVWLPSGSDAAATARSFASFPGSSGDAAPSCESAPARARAASASLRLTQAPRRADLPA